MGRYVEKYWSGNGGYDAMVLIITGGTSATTEDEGPWGCEIKDTLTGLVGTTHSYRSSKSSAYDDAWDDLMQKQNEYYEEQNKLKSRVKDFSYKREILLQFRNVENSFSFKANESS